VSAPDPVVRVPVPADEPSVLVTMSDGHMSVSHTLLLDRTAADPFRHLTPLQRRLLAERLRHWAAVAADGPWSP
jgi:hypothetical protein